jgi:hypothetical protein
MSAQPPGAAGPRLPHPIVPREFPRRSDLGAAAAVAAVLAHLLFAQLTLVLAVVFWLVDRLVRWRPEWLSVPAAAGLIWVLAIGPARAAAGFTAGPGQVASYLAGLAGHPSGLLHLSRGYAGLTGWLPRQLPLALIAAAAEVAAAGWVRRRQDRRWGPAAPYRPGLVVAVRRRYTAAMLAAGGVVTADGACLGLDQDTGRPVAVSWPEAERGMLVTGSDPAGVARSGIQLAWAAIRRRKAVIVIDLTGDMGIAAALAAASAEAGAPLRGFGPDGPGCYEPLRGHPGRTSSLVLGMIDWSRLGDGERRAAAACLADACAIAAAVPAPPGLPVLDDLIGLLRPDALAARAALLPGHHSRRAALAERGEAAAALAAEPAPVTALAEQLALLRASALGRWLRPAGWEGRQVRPERTASRDLAGGARSSAKHGPEPGGFRTGQLTLGQALRDRAVVTFALDRAADRRSARMVAALAAGDLLATLTELRAISARTDCLAWISGCEELPRDLLAELAGCGAQTGAAVLLSTSSAAAAAALADDAGVIIARHLDDARLTEVLGELAARVTGPGTAAGAGDGAGAGHPFHIGGADGFAAGRSDRGRDALALLVRGGRPRYVPAGRAALAVPGGRS